MELAEGDLTSEVEGMVAKDGKVLVIRTIRVAYNLKVAREHRDTARRVHEAHAGFCPVARTLEGCVRIETALGFAD